MKLLCLRYITLSLCTFFDWYNNLPLMFRYGVSSCWQMKAEQGEKNPKAMKNGDFPKDILKNILEQLPIKSLFRFKSVSERWNQLISDPYFTRCYTCRCNHLHRTLLWTKYYNISGWKLHQNLTAAMLWMVYSLHHSTTAK